MKRYIITFVIALVTSVTCYSQVSSSVGSSGYCGTDLRWSFDGQTLTLTNVSKRGLMVSMNNYDDKTPAPWRKKNLNIRRVKVGGHISNIGSCAFKDQTDLHEVVFEGTDLRIIGWGAFCGCTHLRTISLPFRLQTIETIAFAGCSSLNAITIPDQCRIEDLAFSKCDNLQSIEVSPNATLGHYVFAGEINVDGTIRHTLYAGEIRKIPAYINSSNCREYGLSRAAVEKCKGEGGASAVNYDYATSAVDTIIPASTYAHNNTYALILGNQNYRFVPDVPYAIHDARTFAKYCQLTLGIPLENIHVCEDATKQMILDDEMDWISSIRDRENKRLIVYYAGHGVPDINDKNKAYLLPTDVRGTRPSRGIALDDFYASLGDLGFEQTAVFIDACFSGINRDGGSGINEELRAVEIEAQEGHLTSGSLVVFTAAQGNETAQGYREQGHGLFTYFLLREIQETGGFATFGSMADRITENVKRQAPQLRLRKPQTPSTHASGQIADNWRTLRF